MTTPKNIIRRFPPFASFQKFLVSETSTGNISRQEVVSMIPPLLMNLKPGMTVLDLCAAPGSKSAQLIEMVHSGEEARMRSVVRKLLQEDGRELTPDGDEVKLETENGGLADDWSDEGRATGLLIANDVEYRRAHMLIHQMKRLNSPNLIVTNHDATMFPSIKLPSDSSDSKAPNKYLKFDRILADVPCSGDGTPRKNVNVWKDWSPVNGLGLHVTQVRILVRSLQMLKVGGRVVYSTCSMNPIENESVVAAAIERCGGMEKVDVLDCSSELPELKRSSGLKSWPVMDKRGGLWNTWKEVEERKASGDYPDYIGKLSEEMFPPSESDNIPLERCMRVYPHQQDTGGFFITVLEKKSEIKARPANVAKGEFHKKPQTEAAKSELPAPEAAPITATLNELESKAGGNNPGEHIEALDALAPSTADDAEISNASAAQRQNMEHVDEQEKNPRKHALYDEADAAAAVKKPKFREEIDAPAERGEEDRQIHYPPPPSNPPQPAERSAGGGNEPSNENQSSLAPKGDKKKQPQQFEEPFKYLDPNHEVIDTIYDFYKIHPRFPRDRFMVRNAMGTPVKTIYYTSTLAKQILTENEGKGMKFVHCGVKMFVKQDVQSEEVCRWRLQTEGIPLLEAWVGEERVIRLHSRKTFRYLLVEMFPKVTGNGHLDLGEIGKRALQMSMGCCVLRIEKGEGEDSFK
jgi:multisite-specific tRNA:(cytosine-C5)-methyltransferase